MKTLIILILFFLFTIGLGCDSGNRAALNEKELHPDTSLLKNNEIDIILKHTDILYTFHFLVSRDNKSYMIIGAKDERIDAVFFVLINHWKGLEAIKENNGVGYRGSELIGLKLIRTNDDNAKLKFSSIKEIAD